MEEGGFSFSKKTCNPPPLLLRHPIPPIRSLFALGAISLLSLPLSLSLSLQEPQPRTYIRGTATIREPRCIKRLTRDKCSVRVRERGEGGGGGAGGGCVGACASIRHDSRSKKWRCGGVCLFFFFFFCEEEWEEGESLPCLRRWGCGVRVWDVREGRFAWHLRGRSRAVLPETPGEAGRGGGVHGKQYRNERRESSHPKHKPVFLVVLELFLWVERVSTSSPPSPACPCSTR